MPGSDMLQRFQQMGSAGSPDQMRSALLDRLPQAFRDKKSGSSQPPATNVPQATGGFFNRQTPQARLALMQAMAQRARGGAPPVTPPMGMPGQ